MYKYGKPPGLVVNTEDSRSKPWSSDMGLKPSFTQKLDGNDGPHDYRKTNVTNKNNKDSQMRQVTPKKQ